MSDVQNTVAPAAVEEVKPVEGVSPITEPVVATELPKPEAAEETKTEAAPAAEEPKAEEAAVEEKAVEPVTEGQLAYKGPGLVKSLIASKKEFWLNDAVVEAEHLDLFLRGEKPEVAHPIVAWASQTGKGLLFFNKKGDTDHTHPSSILDLYNATDLKKESGHQFAFKLNGSAHTFKAANDAERDGWYISVEKAIELGKASQEEVQGSEGYKAELEKLNKSQTPAVAAGAAKTRSQSQPKKSTDIDRANSVTGEEDAEKKKQKSRSTSRGLFGRRKPNVEEIEQKPVEKEADKEETKDEAKPEVEAAAATGTVAAAGAVATEAVTGEEKPAEAATETAEPTEAKAEEAPKPVKRNSIFGKLSGWGAVKSPSKEKDQKEAELKPETPVVEAPTTEVAPVTAEPAEAETALPIVGEPSAEAAKEDVVTPTKEKSKFLSGLGFVKRGRSVSPSNIPKEAPKTEETPAAVADVAAEPVVPAEEPATEAVAPVEAADKPAEEAKTETPANKRQSILGSLGRRASKAFRGIQSPKQETAPAASEATKEEEETTTETAPVEVGAETKALEAEAAQNHIGDVVPEAVSVGQPEHSTPTVTASA